MIAATAGVAADARVLRVGRVTVLAAVGVLLTLFLTGLVLWATHSGSVVTTWSAPDGWTTAGMQAVLAGWSVPVGWYVGYFIGLEVLLTTVTVVSASFVLRGTLSWFRLYLVFVLVLFATAGGGVPAVLAALYPAAADLLLLVQGVAWIALFPLAYVFPDGRFVPGWSRWLVLGWTGWLLASLLSGSAGESAVEFSALMLLFATAIGAQVYRYRRISGPVERLQTRWVLFAVALRLAYTLGLVLTPVLARQEQTDAAGLALYASTMLLSYLVAAALPAAIATAIVRHRLFAINVVINRTLAYGVLTAFVIGTYALVVGGIGALWRSGGVALPLVATGLVAVAFSPVRERVQRWVNRLVYGERHDPYGVLSRLGRQLAGVMQPAAVAPAIVDAVARALKAPYVAVVGPDGPLAQTGDRVADSETFTLTYQGQALGRLVVGRHTPGDRLTPTDRRLLTDLADHCGAALYAAQESERTRRLAADLQRTREQLVTTREEERRRIRRDLHDSLGPALSGQALAIDAARALLATDPDAADRLLRDLKEHSQEALGEVRRLARQLRPPVLDELGLAAALENLRELYQPQGLPLTVDIEPLPPLPAAVEVATYRITQEALTNVVRHAGAGACRVAVTVGDGVLELVVGDDGRGIPPGRANGVGTASMRERAEELGGTLHLTTGAAGTTVTARLPLLERD